MVQYSVVVLHHAAPNKSRYIYRFVGISCHPKLEMVFPAISEYFNH